MHLYEDQLFHIYNQGNNRRQIFFTDENYEYFLWKMRGYLLPFGDLISYTLMPNHFHWQFYVGAIAIERKTFREHIDAIEFERRVLKYGPKAVPVNKASQRTKEGDSMITLNEAIGNLLKGYTRAINKERNWSGSLFRGESKAKDGWLDQFVTVQKNRSDDWRFLPGNDYGYSLLNYIHENAVTAGLVEKAVDYKWSSARDYAGLGKGSLCNLEVGREILSFI